MEMKLSVLISIVIYVVIVIFVIRFVVKDILTVIEGDHTGGGKPRGKLGLRGFLMMTFFMLFTCLWAAIFWQ